MLKSAISSASEQMYVYCENELGYHSKVSSKKCIRMNLTHSGESNTSQPNIRAHELAFENR
jgi:hypothetical protein